MKNAFRRVVRGCCRLPVAAVVVAMLITTSARAQIMTMVPAESMVVIKIKNLQDLSQKISVLSQQWGLNQMRPELSDPLGNLLLIANLGPGLDKAGEVGIALLAPAQGAHDPDVVALVSVTDYKTFTAALPNAKTEGELTTFSPKPNGKPIFVANWGKYAAISPNQALVAAKGAGIAVPAATAKELDSKDIVAFANVKVLRKMFLPQMQQMKPKMLEEMTRGIQQAPNANPQMVAVVTAYMNQFLAGVEELFTDTDAATFGINLSKDGIATTFLADFDPNSYLGKAAASIKNTDASYTAGLPDGKYLFYGGMTVDPAVIGLMNDFIGPIEKAAGGAGDQGKSIAAYFAGIRSYMAATKQVNFGLVAPPANAMAQGTGFIQGVSVITGDAAKLNASAKSMSENSAAIMAMSGGTNMKSIYEPGAKTVAGVTLDKIGTSMAEPQTPQEQQMAFIMTLMYGKAGPVGYMGVAAPDRSINVMGGTDAFLEAAVTSAKANTDALAGGPAAKVTAALAGKKVAAFYLPVDQIATTVLDIMAARGMPGGVKLPPNLPPLGGAIVTDGPAVRADGFVPSQTVQSLIAAGMQLYLQAMPGGAQGGGL